MRHYKHATERRAARAALRAAEVEALVERELDQAEWEKAQELHEELCALHRGRSQREYEWSLRARQARYEARRTWERALRNRAAAKAAKQWGPREIEWFLDTARWCIERMNLANHLEQKAREAAEAWYREAVQDLD